MKTASEVFVILMFLIGGALYFPLGQPSLSVVDDNGGFS